MAYEAIKKLMPWPIRRLSRKIKERLFRYQEARMDTKELFTEIYTQNKWGGKPGEFYSGPSSDEDMAKPYVDAISSFIGAHSIKSILDIGCGDFRIGKAIVSENIRYVGMDIVEPLIARNRQLYESSNVSFMVGDVVEDELPPADLCLVREVLQHLTNSQIKKAISKFGQFRWIIVTDHQLGKNANIIPNRDKPSGAKSRVSIQSNLALNEPPFDLKNVEFFLETSLTSAIFHSNEVLRSFLIENDNPAI